LSEKRKIDGQICPEINWLKCRDAVTDDEGRIYYYCNRCRSGWVVDFIHPRPESHLLFNPVWGLLAVTLTVLIMILLAFRG